MSKFRQIDAATRRNTIARNISLRAGGLGHIADSDDDEQRDEELTREIRQKLNKDIKIQRAMVIYFNFLIYLIYFHQDSQRLSFCCFVR